ncbi:helix-turn-helix transcriptional regulator [Dactylosporangium roseum]|uniref:Helix-turn-helix transcriptional regulator n=1 Tax=Dactylosporangium roseum TaxID=47989 RepID=A0ABY5Z9Y2_9ACTN|nr:helix-turn-helix transcriptional regulator [Dactylosporangium roseum]UWZ38874.1 helix-turn-helix transcriptional regulator [Dactylosporangium roseum]
MTGARTTTHPAARRLVLGAPARQLFDAATADPLGPLCAQVRAPGGHGKSALLQALGDALTAAGVRVVTPWQADAEPDGDAVLLVDDAHLLGPDRLAALRDRVRRGMPRLVLAYRPWPRPVALLELVDALPRVRPPLTLTPFGPEQVRAYLAHAWELTPAPEVTSFVAAQTAGVPAYVVRLAAALAASGGRHGGARLEVPAAAVAGFTAELDELDPDVRRALLAAEAGLGLRMDLLGALLDCGPEGVGAVLEAARATGLVGRDGQLVPITRTALATLTPTAERVAVWQRLTELQLDRRGPVLPLVRALLGTGPAGTERLGGTGMAAAFEAAAEEALDGEPALAAELFAAAAAAGRPTVVRQARAAALAGDVDAALRLADQVVAAPDSPERAEGALLAATAIAHRGQLGRSAELYRWSNRGPSPAFAAIGLLATGRLAEAEAALRDSPGDGPPTLLTGAASLMARGVRESVTGTATGALSTLVQAAALLESAGPAVPLPDGPAALAGLVALHCGELDIGESVLDRAIASRVGGALLATRHGLLRAWLEMVRGNLTAADAQLTAVTADRDRLEPRDLVFAAALGIGLARRRSDLVALHRGWPAACEALVRHPVDLFTMLPLGEFAIAAARLGQQRWLATHLREADLLLAAVAEPPLWAVPLHWSALHAAVIAEQPSVAARHVTALAAHSGHSAYAAAAATAAASWLEVLNARVDPAAVEAAARGLHGVGFRWDGARLAGQAAIRTTDRRAMTALLECARLLQGRGAGRAGAAAAEPSPRPGGDGSADPVLSAREREVARLVLEGLTYREVGDRLFIAAKTVEHHMARMRQRLGCASRADLLARLRILIDDDTAGAVADGAP